MEQRYGIQLTDLRTLQKRRKRLGKWARFFRRVTLISLVCTIIFFGVSLIHEPPKYLNSVDVPANFHLVAESPTSTPTDQDASDDPATVGSQMADINNSFNGLASVLTNIMPIFGMIGVLIAGGLAVMTQNTRALLGAIVVCGSLFVVPMILFPDAHDSPDGKQEVATLTWAQRVAKSGLSDDARGWYILEQNKLVDAQDKNSKAAPDAAHVAALGTSKYVDHMSPKVLYLLEMAVAGHPISKVATAYLNEANKSVDRWRGRGIGGAFDTILLALLTVALAFLERHIRHRLQRVIGAIRHPETHRTSAESGKNFETDSVEVQQEA